MKFTGLTEMELCGILMVTVHDINAEIVMQVETFEEISLDAQQDGSVINELVSEEALALIETLGLEGQRGLVQRSKGVSTDGDSTETRIPYRQITEEESRIFQLVMPSKTKLADFDMGPIPLRVLQIAARAQPIFEKLEVWHPRTVQEKDPVLVGTRKKAGSSWQEETFILARWGEVLVSLDELRVKARDILRTHMNDAISEGRQALQEFEAGISTKMDLYLRGERVSSKFINLAMDHRAS